MLREVGADLTGSCEAVAWRRVAGDGTITDPLRQDAAGLRICTADGQMAGDTTVHHIAESPSWSGEEQSQPLSNDGDELVLRTPAMQAAGGSVVNELHWIGA
jgi:hypothetical protein